MKAMLDHRYLDLFSRCGLYELFAAWFLNLRVLIEAGFRIGLKYEFVYLT